MRSPKSSINAIIISVTSDIGAALAKRWSQNSWNIFGTYRTESDALDRLKIEQKVQLVHCDLLDLKSIDQAACTLLRICPEWDVLVLAPGSVEPIGKFHETNFSIWEEGIQLNLLRQLRIVHKLLPSRNLKTQLPEPCVLFFAGGGTNGSVVNYSSYTLSKIALIKMCEFLDSEIADTRFVILGPGCVKTKIHEPTLKLASQTNHPQFVSTAERLSQEERCVPMEKVVDSSTWLVTTPCKDVRGRNFSTAQDRWGSLDLEKELAVDPDMYKLRRFKNSWVREEECKR